MRAAGAAVAGLALAGAVQAPAQAAGTSAQAVPSCVTGTPYYLVTVSVRITNNCTTTQRVNVKYTKNGVTYIPDKCHSVAPGQTVTTGEPAWVADRYVGLISC
jgi:hypothetical protein